MYLWIVFILLSCQVAYSQDGGWRIHDRKSTWFLGNDTDIVSVHPHLAALRVTFRSKITGATVEVDGIREITFIDPTGPTPTSTASPTITQTPTITPTPTITNTPTISPTPTCTGTATNTPLPTCTPTPLPKDFIIFESSFWLDTEDSVTHPIPRVSMKFLNNTGVPISRLGFRAVLSSPDRSVPWMNSSISWDIPGGIEPSEAGTVGLKLNMFSDWAKVPRHLKDLKLVLTAILAEGPNGEPIPLPHSEVSPSNALDSEVLNP